jgi:hypothetical protein
VTEEPPVTIRVSGVVGEQLGPWESNQGEGFVEHEEAEQIRLTAAPECAGGSEEIAAARRIHVAWAEVWEKTEGNERERR